MEALNVTDLPGTVRATVLIETILAAFEMDEILWELRGPGSTAALEGSTEQAQF